MAPASPFTRSPVRQSPATTSAVETSPAPAPRAGDTYSRELRVFWSAGGDCIFRDHTGRKVPVHPIRMTRLKLALHKMAEDTRCHVMRARICAIHAEAEEALTRTLDWRRAAAGWVS